jgi:hypothetical protein
MSNSNPVVGQIKLTEVLYLTITLCFRQTYIHIPTTQPLHTIVVCYKQNFVLPLNKLLYNFVERLCLLYTYMYITYTV